MTRGKVPATVSANVRPRYDCPSHSYCTCMAHYKYAGARSHPHATTRLCPGKMSSHRGKMPSQICHWAPGPAALELLSLGPRRHCRKFRGHCRADVESLLQFVRE